MSSIVRMLYPEQCGMAEDFHRYLTENPLQGTVLHPFMDSCACRITFTEPRHQGFDTVSVSFIGRHPETALVLGDELVYIQECGYPYPEVRHFDNREETISELIRLRDNPVEEEDEGVDED